MRSQVLAGLIWIYYFRVTRSRLHRKYFIWRGILQISLIAFLKSYNEDHPPTACLPWHDSYQFSTKEETKIPDRHRNSVGTQSPYCSFVVFNSTKTGAFGGFYWACKKLCNMYYNFPFCRMSPIYLIFENPDSFSKGDGNLTQESDEDYNQNVIRKLRIFVIISRDSELFRLSNEYYLFWN